MKQVSLMRSVKILLLSAATVITMNSFGQATPAKFELSQGNTITKVIASPSLDVQVYPGKGPARFVLITNNPAGERLRIRLNGSSGQVYERFTNKKNMRTIFDLSQIEDDSYTLTVTSSDKKVSKELVLRTTYAAAARKLEIQ